MLSDLSAEYYCLRAGHERALADAAGSDIQRAEHLRNAERYAALMNQAADPSSIAHGPGDASIAGGG